ncbi:MAG: FAD-binding protein [Burkholderiales bacterium]|nr:FAD-binding protein [Burkholderiales bacterium]
MLLKLDHLGPEVINQRLPGIREIAIKFANVDPVRDPIPVVPTVHYQMGGIPTNYLGQVVAPEGASKEALVPGFYAAGECACVSVHGANRLGTNSLLDLLVFGKAAGEQMIRDIAARPRPHRNAAEGRRRPHARAARATRRGSLGRARRRRHERSAPHDAGATAACSAFPTTSPKGVAKMKEIAERAARTYITDRSKVFNTARVEALELDNMVETAMATVISAEARKESRGAHGARGLPGARRRELAQAHALVQARATGSTTSRCT